MTATIRSAVLQGVFGQAVDVEVHVGRGIPGFTIVGLPDASCRESRDRVRAAVLSSKLGWPDKRVTVNLAPGGVRKEGAGLDLAIAVAVLVAGGELTKDQTSEFGFVAELGLDGALRRVPGTLSLVEAAEAPRVVVAEDAMPRPGSVAIRRSIAPPTSRNWCGASGMRLRSTPRRRRHRPPWRR